MRLTSLFFRNARQPQNEKKVPFRAMEPLALKNYMLKNSWNVAERGCLYETTMLLTCLEENENEEKNCIPQFKTLTACYEGYYENIKKYKTKSKNIAPNSKNYTAAQATYLLRKYPTV